MRVSLHDRASNTYCGQWPREKAAVCCIESPAIAHSGLAAVPESAPLTRLSEITQQIPLCCAGNSRFDKKQKARTARPYTVCRILSLVMSGASARCQSASRAKTFSPALTV